MNVQIYDAATEWLVRHRSGGLDVAEKSAFDVWLRESPQHVRAYLEMSSVWEGVPSLDSAWNPPAAELIARAREDATVVPLSPALPSIPLSNTEAHVDSARSKEARSGVRASLQQFFAVAASLLTIGLGIAWYLGHDSYRTGVGEQRLLTLEDGSTVQLNSRSQIRLEYSARERRIDLLAGQALFHVAQNVARPFVVQSGNTRVRAIGTTFDVNKKTMGTVVTVVEGRVAVRTGERPASDTRGDRAPLKSIERNRKMGGMESGLNERELLLSGGEQLVVGAAIAVSPQRANLAAATAWTQRSLVFEFAPLPEVAEEFNRYNSRPLVIESRQLADFHVSGVFSSVQPVLLLQFLRAQPELVVEETDREIRIRRK